MATVVKDDEGRGVGGLAGVVVASAVVAAAENGLNLGAVSLAGAGAAGDLSSLARRDVETLETGSAY